MKHAREDYDRIQDPEGKIPADEPVFLLRGQDRLAHRAVSYYAMLAREAGCIDVATASEKQARAMCKRLLHKAKLPDMPGQGEKTAPVGHWYWSDNGGEWWRGPHDTIEDAMVDAYEHDANGAKLSQMAPMALQFDMDMADVFLRRNEDQNFEGDAYIPDYAAWELDFLTGLLLRGWVDKYDLRKEFRSLDHLPGGRTCFRPRCDLALASITGTTYVVPVATVYVSV